MWSSVGLSHFETWVECLGACVLEAGCALSLSLSFLSSSLGSSFPNLNTIHPQALALISPFVRLSFRVGLEEKLLLVTGYAWTPRSWTTVEVARLGLVS